MKQVFHLSFPVRNLDEAIAFYTSHLGAVVGRKTPQFVDLFLWGAQITLHGDLAFVVDPVPHTRHFGATVDWMSWEAIASRLRTTPLLVEGPKFSHVGEPIEQAKLMITDPSGNLIEIKAYRNPRAILGELWVEGE